MAAPAATGTVLFSTHRLEVAGVLRERFRAEGYAVDLIPDPEHLRASGHPVLLILTGERRGEEGSDLATWLEVAQGRLEIPVFTLLSGEGGRLRGRMAGAEEAFGDPLDPEEIVLLGHRTVQRRRLQQITGIVGESDPIRQVLERIVQIAPADSTVLITGESGTGKELVARGIHALSGRRHRAFLAVNVAALTETLLESELFGHEKGAFTGAIDSRKGFFELAHRGTLFLDEIGEMPLSTQTKLLRVLEQKEFLRVGGERAIEVDVRIIAATNQDLREAIASGAFRRDLYYRLNILGIELPPLRRRREDIPRLVQHFVREVTARVDRPFPGLTPEALELLVEHEWPGNIRELRNLVESMVVLSPGRPIGPPDLPREVRLREGGLHLLPAPSGTPRVPLQPRQEGVGELAPLGRPELEFIFRTLVDLRVDMDHLKREVERYRSEVEESFDARRSARWEVESLPVATPVPTEVSLSSTGVLRGEGQGGEGFGDVDSTGARTREADSFLQGLTMDELEERAIRVALAASGGNRRRAAEQLGIGERTLYRKIQKFGLDGG